MKNKQKNLQYFESASLQCDCSSNGETCSTSADCCGMMTCGASNKCS